jgi:hypothetical protein
MKRLIFFWIGWLQTWQLVFTVLFEQLLQQLCPHWNTTLRTFTLHSGQLMVSVLATLLSGVAVVRGEVELLEGASAERLPAVCGRMSMRTFSCMRS